MRGNSWGLLHDNDLKLSVPAPRDEPITNMRLADCSSLEKPDMADTSNTRKEDIEGGVHLLQYLVKGPKIHLKTGYFPGRISGEDLNYEVTRRKLGESPRIREGTFPSKELCVALGEISYSIRWLCPRALAMWG